MGARVPVLKYKCALSGLDCDISIQGSAALLKANIMALLNQHCPMLSPLYRCAGGHRGLPEREKRGERQCCAADRLPVWRLCLC